MSKRLNNRREFLKKVCPTIAFAMFGLSFLEACSTGNDSDNNNGNNNQGDNSDNNDNSEIMILLVTHHQEVFIQLT